MLVDFHVHSTASDGTDSPATIASKSRHFAAVALTDHDNIDGIDEFMNAPSVPLSRNASICCRRIAGTELSIEPGKGFDRFHLLALGINRENKEFQDYLRKIVIERDERNARILKNFQRIGIEIDHRELAQYSGGNILARPHFARWLVDHGFAKSIIEAFDKYLLDDSPQETRCFVERWRPPQEETFALIHRAGGIAVMAHPKYWRQEWKRTNNVDYELAERELSILKEKGLDGIEALYQANLPEENCRFTQIADRIGLLKSAGSDYHGLVKLTITIGMEVEEDFIMPLLERLNVITR